MRGTSRFTAPSAACDRCESCRLPGLSPDQMSTSRVPVGDREVNEKIPEGHCGDREGLCRTVRTGMGLPKSTPVMKMQMLWSLRWEPSARRQKWRLISSRNEGVNAEDPSVSGGCAPSQISTSRGGKSWSLTETTRLDSEELLPSR